MLNIAHNMLYAQLFSMVVEAGWYDHYEQFAMGYQGGGDFEVLWEYYQLYGEYIENENPGWQHEYMAENYIDDISAGLAALHPYLSSQGFIDYWDGSGFYLNNGPEYVNWSWDSFFTALAWEGLMSNPDEDLEYNMDAWENLTDREKQLYIQYQANNYESNKCN